MVTNLASNMPPEATSKALNLKSEVGGFAKLPLNKCIAMAFVWVSHMECSLLGFASPPREAQQKP